jgi:hypothetical protein
MRYFTLFSKKKLTKISKKTENFRSDHIRKSVFSKQQTSPSRDFEGTSN